MTFFIYSRKSVLSEKGESIENQVEMCRQYIFSKFPEADDMQIAVYEDEGFSARTTDRPRFQQMCRDLRTEKPDFLVCYRLDRISRSVSDFSALMEELNARDIALICIREEFDTSKPMGKAMMYIASVFAQLERETLAERVRDNMQMLARTGRWLGGTPPTGFRSEQVRELMLDGKIKSACKLRPVPEELQAVTRIFESFLELHSLSGVSKRLLREGIRSRTGKPYSPPGIKQILQNPVYCRADPDAYAYLAARNAQLCFSESECSEKRGLLAYNKRDYRKQGAPRQDMEQWIIAIGRHPGQISGRKWAAVQDILRGNRAADGRSCVHHHAHALLSGLLTCGLCGSPMFAKSRTGQAADHTQYDYLCGRKLRFGALQCACQNLSGAQTDALACDALLARLPDCPIPRQELERLRAQALRQAHEDPAAAVRSRLRSCRAESARLMALLSREIPERNLLRHVDARLSELDREAAALEAVLRESESAADPAGDVHAVAEMTASLRCLSTIFPTLSVQEKRRFLRLLVKKAVWDGTELHLFLTED